MFIFLIYLGFVKLFISLEFRNRKRKRENKWTNMVLYHRDNYVVFLFRFGNSQKKSPAMFFGKGLFFNLLLAFIKIKMFSHIAILFSTVYLTSVN